MHPVVEILLDLQLAEKPRLLTVAVFTFCLTVRWLVGLHPYSGMHTPPKFGDYEAQRHWMEVTLNLPVSDWYRQTQENDLQWWGLDYPPLSAAAALVFGVLARAWDPDMVSLFASRGYESEHSKVFMRMTVWLVDAVLLLPITYLAVKSLYTELGASTEKGTEVGECSKPPVTGSSPSSSPRISPNSGAAVLPAATNSATAVAAPSQSRRDRRKRQRKIEQAQALAFVRRLTLFFMLALQPPLLLIDHGHFQYNNLSLAPTLLAVVCILGGYEGLGSLFFCLALNVKQMALYYSLAFFFYLFSSFIRRKNFMWHFFKTGVIVLSAFAFCWLPFCYFTAPGSSCIVGLKTVFFRVFPVERGLFEDKVANLMCLLDFVFKLNRKVDKKLLLKFSALATLCFSMPSCFLLMCRRPSRRAFLLSLFNISIAFFLCSYQVHEKSILLPLLPASLLMGEATLPVSWLVLVATYSLFPLLVKDNLVVPYLVLMALYSLITFVPACFLPSLLFSPHLSSSTVSTQTRTSKDSTAKASQKVSKEQLGGPQNASGRSDDKQTHSPEMHSKTYIVGDRRMCADFPPGYGEDGKPLGLFILFLQASFALAILLQVFNLCYTPPKRYPDVHVYLNAIYCCGHFLLAWAYGNYWLWRETARAKIDSTSVYNPEIAESLVEKKRK